MSEMDAGDYVIILIFIALSISLYVNLIMIFKFFELLNACQQINTAMLESCSQQPTCCWGLHNTGEISSNTIAQYLRLIIPGEQTT